MKQYHLPQIGTMNGIALVFIGTTPRLFLQTFTEQLSINGQAAWLGIVMNSLLAVLMMLLLLFLKNRLNGDFLFICNKLVGKWISCIIQLFYSMIFLANAALLLRDYVESTKISALHDADYQLITLVYGVAIIVAAYLGIEVIARAGSFIMPLILIGSVIVIALLFPFYQIYQLLPLFGNGFKPLLFSSVRGAGYNLLAILIIILAPSFQNDRSMKAALVWGLGGSAMLKLFYALALVVTFGVEVGMEKILPFFEMARLVYINHYLQRIEAPLIIIWVMFGMLAIALSVYVAVYLIARTLNLTALRPLIPLVTVFIITISMLPENFDQVIKYESLLLNFETVGIYVIPVMLLSAYFIKGKGPRCVAKEV